MNVKRIALLVLLISVLAAGLVFGQTAQSVAGNWVGTHRSSAGTVTFQMYLQQNSTFIMWANGILNGQVVEDNSSGTFIIVGSNIHISYRDGTTGVGLIRGSEIIMDGVTFRRR